METLERSCDQKASYPCNLVHPGLPLLILDGLRQELHRQSSRIFCGEQDATVDFLELQSPGRRELLPW